MWARAADESKTTSRGDENYQGVLRLDHTWTLIVQSLTFFWGSDIPLGLLLGYWDSTYVSVAPRFAFCLTL